MGNGTGFIYKPKTTGNYFLVTNYHVLTCRDPKNPKSLMPNFMDSPDEIEFKTFSKPNLEPKIGSIKIDAESHWIEHPERANGVDIIALPITFPNDTKITILDDLNLDQEMEIEVGSDIFIVGYPWGYGSGNSLFPIWKRGTIASEPMINEDGMAKFFIDSHTTPGMSGSPIFAISKKDVTYVNKETKDQYSKYETGEISALDFVIGIDTSNYINKSNQRFLKFIGIYSGRLVLPQGIDPNLGIVWKNELIEELFSKGVPTKHPYPPINVDQ